jgi:hypothetical protein
MGLNKLAAAALAGAFVIATAGIGYAQSSSTGGKASTSSSMSKPSGGTTGLERAEESGSAKGIQEKNTHGKAFQREEKTDTTTKDRR